jgi:hypothetical protein
VSGILSRVFRAEALACSHCGSTDLYPYAGLLGRLGGVLRRVRYACRACRRHTWLSPDAEIPQPPEDELEVEVPPPPIASASLEALDIAAAPLPSPRTDLRALDDDLARAQRQRNNH